MKIKLDINKTLEQNAEDYYSKAKKSRKKIEGAKEAIEISQKKLEKEKKNIQKEKIDIQKKEEKKKEWYEKFHWFFTSEGFLCIGGRDATSNEIVVKKHLDKDDLVFHTEMAGSPFFIIKTEGKKPDKKSIDEAAIGTASYSRAWKAGFSSSEVFYVNPDQVTKEAQSGEFIPKGAFMIYGKKNTMKAEVKLAIGIKDNKIISGPAEPIKKHAEKFVILVPGNNKTSDIAKKIKKKLGGELDDIIRAIPAGGAKLL